MDNKILKTVLAGIIGTAVMTLVTMIAPMMGMPKMSPPDMLAGILGVPVLVGWIMHFMIGIIFAFAYSCLFKININNIWVKGALFGVAAFLFALVMMMIMGTMMPLPKMEGSMVLMILGGLMGHLIFGMAVAKIVGSNDSGSPV